MAISALLVSVFLFLATLFSVKSDFIAYNTTPRIVPGKINVHLVPHSHDDVGWLKTVDQYFVGANNSIRGACVQNVLDSMISALLEDKNRKFIYVEIAFFQRWWRQQSEAMKVKVKELVQTGQLVFIIDYQDRAKRLREKTLEVVWQGSKSLGPSSQIFTGIFSRHYDPPDGFVFEINDVCEPIQDDTQLFDYNVQERVNDFVAAAIAQANVTRTNHIMWCMGTDFRYQYANSWFRQMDKFIHYVNQLAAIFLLAVVHSLGNLFNNMSLGKVAVSFTHTIKAIEVLSFF